MASWFSLEGWRYGYMDTLPVDAETLVRVAGFLRACRGPNEARDALELFAGQYGVRTSDLATDVLAILSNLA